MHLSYRPNNTIVFLHVFLILKIFVVGTLDLNFLIVQRDQGIQLVSEAICAGIFNDLGSGSNVDVCVITKVCLYLIRALSRSDLQRSPLLHGHEKQRTENAYNL